LNDVNKKSDCGSAALVTEDSQNLRKCHVALITFTMGFLYINSWLVLAMFRFRFRFRFNRIVDRRLKITKFTANRKRH